jgi:lipopolysaccharide/colanic/teichoic acid biosynthesis glycosyltransferase
MDHPDGVDQAARQHGIHVLISANMSHVLSFWLVLQQVGPVIGLSLRPVRLTGKQEVAKRVFALVVGSILLLVTLPIWLAAELAIRLASPEPVFFQQEPVAKGGRTLHMYKFRTMRDGITSSLDTTAPFFKLDHDPWVTPARHLLRKWSLDELPQPWNVICGEMSLVGPRPLPAE